MLDSCLSDPKLTALVQLFDKKCLKLNDVISGNVLFKFVARHVF